MQKTLILLGNTFIARGFPGSIPGPAPGRFPESPWIVDFAGCGKLSSRYKYKNMKAIIWNQINPTKSLKQLVSDRNVFRLIVLAGLAMSWCA